jgi:hypothetical protein
MSDAANSRRRSVSEMRSGRVLPKVFKQRAPALCSGIIEFFLPSMRVYWF